MSLTFRRVEYIRTSGLPDTLLARRWGVTPSTIHQARTGKTWPEHPTKPDCAPRAHKGNWHGC
jgi:hypothetical protein